jgi:hypothetical protein
MGAQLKVGYSIKHIINWDANVKAEMGYGLTHIGDYTESGVQYGASATVTLYKHLAVGYKYKVVDAGFGEYLESHIGFVQWTW